MTLKSFKKDLKKFVLNEAKILKEIEHKNIIKYYNWYETRNHFWVIYEYLGGTNLRQIVEEDGQIEEPLLRQITITLLETLIFLHQKDIFFCDFKPSNFLLDEYSNLKFGDFILAQMKLQIEFQSEIFSADVNYMAPEIDKSRGYIFQANQNTEIYGFGSLLYYLASGQPPSNDSNQKFKPVKGFSSKFNQLIEGCLQHNPRQRFNFQQIINTEWIGVLKDSQQQLNDMLVASKNFDQISDISEQLNFNLLQGNIDQPNLQRMTTGHFLDDNSMTIRNTQSEQYLERKNSLNKDNMSEKSVNYLDSSMKNQQIIIDQSDESKMDFQVPYEIFSKETQIIEKKLLYLAKDKIIEFITMNDKIEKVSLGKVEQILKLDESDFESEENIIKNLNLLFKKYKEYELVDDKTSILKFMVKLTSLNKFSDVLIKHQLYTQLMSDLCSTSNQSLRYYLCIVIGCVFRFITTDVKIVQIITYENVFKELIDSNNVEVSHKALGAFGEIMFYLYTQTKQNQNQISISFLSYLANSLKQKIDDIIYLRYAAKVIENCSSTQCGKVFATKTFVKNLLLCQKKNKDTILNSFCLNIFKYLLDVDPSLVTFITTKDNISFFFRQIIKENHKTSIDAINLLNKIFILLKSNKLESILKKVGLSRVFEIILENMSTTYHQISAKFIVTLSILITKNFHFFEYILTYTKILHVIDQKLLQRKNINDYFIQTSKVLHDIIAKILRYWFDKWNKAQPSENLNQQCVICCSYLYQLSEVQFFIENYINEENLIEIFNFEETITTQIDAQNYDILKSNYVQTLQNILKSDLICSKYENIFILKIIPLLIQSLKKEQIESVLFMNFSIFINIFNTFFSQNQIENISIDISKVIIQIVDLTQQLIQTDHDDEIPLNCFKILSILLSKQYLKNIPEQFNPKQFTLIIRKYIGNDCTKLNVSIFSLLIFILQQNQSYIFKFKKYNIIDYAIQYLKLLNKNNYEHQIFYFFYTVFEIIHKSQKLKKLPEDYQIDIKSISFIMKKLYKDFFSKNVVEEDMLNVFYYCFQILQIYQVRTKTSIHLDFHIENKIVLKLKDMYSNDPILLKKVQKLIKMTSQLFTQKILKQKLLLNNALKN